MNCKILIELLATSAAMAVLCGSANASPPPHTVESPQQPIGDVSVARGTWQQCVRAAIPRVDEPQTSSAAVARAAMKNCSNQYTAMMQAVSQALPPACDHDPACTRAALAKAEREAMQSATDDVVTERVQVAGAQVLKCQ